MRRIWLASLCLIFVLVACGPTKPPHLTTSTTIPTPSPPWPGNFSVNGLVYDATQGDSGSLPLYNSHVQFQIRRDGKTLLVGEVTPDQQGRFTIGVHIQQEDLLFLQASAPGYMSVERYLTAEEIAVGVTAGIGLEPPAAATLSIEGFQWTPARLDPTIKEWPNQDTGGLGRLYVMNTGTLPARFDELQLDGLSIASQIAARRVQWSRIWPEPLPPGKMGIWEIKIADTPERMRLSIYPREMRPAHAEVEPIPSPLSISYLTLTKSGEQILAFAHNNDPVALIELESVFLNGGQVQAEIKQRDLGPGETSLVIITPDTSSIPLDLACVQIQGRFYQGETTNAWGAIRLREPYFPIGTWPDARELDQKTLAAIEEQGIDTLVLDLPDSHSDPLWAQLQDNDDLHLLAVPRFPADRAQLANFAGDPQILAWFISDEPEYRLNRDLYGEFGEPMDLGNTTEQSWRLAPSLVTEERTYREVGGHPTYINYSVYRLMSKYAPIPDIAGSTHFAIDAPGANSKGSHPLEEVLTYTLGLRYHSSPAPIWPWAQALCSTSWYENTNACWNRQPTPAEMRAQLYLQIAAGAKGILWFTHREALVADAPEQWKEVGRQNRVLRAVRELLLYGDPAATVMHEKGQIYASAIVSERAVVVPIINLDYGWESHTWLEGQDPPPPSPPYEFHPREKLSFSVLMPEWITPEEAFLVGPEGTMDITWSAEARLVTLSLKSLEDVALIVIAGDGELRAEISEQLK